MENMEMVAHWKYWCAFWNVTIWREIFKIDTKTSVIYAIAFISTLFLIRFFLTFAKEGLKYFHEVYKNSVYGDAIILLKDSFASMHYYRKTPGHQDSEFMKAIIVLCNNLQQVYENIIKAECSVSIKVPLSDEKVDERTVLMNLTRDINHSSRDTAKYLGIKHTLIGNTAFISSFNKVIRQQKEKHYLNNSINTTKNYDNTSIECYENGKLPYNSELVYPIIPLINDSTKNHDCLGFICVDSIKENAFGTKYDIGILEGVADGIYDVISARNYHKNSDNGKK